jgi:DNA-binding HxlR family transcriptional regulator
MPEEGYNQFCPVAMAAEILGARWTLLLLRELILGSTRFNQLRRGLPKMSPALLSKRLKELEAAGIVARVPVPDEPGVFEYGLSEAGRELRPIVEAAGVWGQKWVTTEATLKNLDPDLLMWDVRRNVNADPLPPGRSVIEFIFTDCPASEGRYWLIVGQDRTVDVCKVDPGFDVDLYVSTDLRTLTEIWLGYTSIERAKDENRLTLTGARTLEANLSAWFKLSVFAGVAKKVA